MQSTKSSAICLSDTPWQIKALLILQLSLWTLVPLSVHTSLPLDVVELTSLSQEWVLTTYKHPNLPGWLLDLAFMATNHIEIVYLLSQLAIVSAYLAIFFLAKELLDERKAILATLLTSTIYYYHWATPEFNHNVLQIPLWAWCILSAWKAVTRNKTRWWITLGLTAGLMLNTKYSAGILLLFVFLWVFAEPKARCRLSTAGPWIALLTSLLILTPQAYFLFAEDFLPIKYATERAKSGGLEPAIIFLASQLIDHLFFFVLILIGGLIGRNCLTQRTANPETPNKGRFLLFTAIAPVVFTAALPLIADIGLKPMWGTPMFNLSAIVFLYWFGGRSTDNGRFKRLIIASYALVCLVPALYLAVHLVQLNRGDAPLRTLWPQASISEDLRGEFQKETGNPLHLVLGHYWDAGLVAGPSNEVRVLSDGDSVKSPWISQKLLDDQGYLIIWPSNKTPAASLDSWINSAISHGLIIRNREWPWTSQPNATPVKLSYIIVPPATAVSTASPSAERLPET